MKKALQLIFTILVINTSNAQKLMISELADPDDNSGCRFVEIHCEGPLTCDLSNYDLRRWTNGNADPTGSTIIDLSPIGTLAPNENAVIAADGADFLICYGFAPDIDAGTGGPADSNGDDQIGLFNNGVLVDIFGVPGEDGSNTCHEFEDGRAIRNADVDCPTATWDESEWTVWSDGSSASGCTNHNAGQPQDAADMNPGFTVLPVKFSSFKATYKNHKTLLNWKTESEVNNDYFTVEYSSDASNYREIGKVNGSGTSSFEQSYSFVHDSPESTLNYYRLKQIDFDGSYEYSPVQVVQLRKSSGFTLYPTRAFNQLTIEVEGERNTESTLKVFDLTGQLVLNQMIPLNTNEVQIDISNLSKGHYFLTVENGSTVSTDRFFKVF